MNPKKLRALALALVLILVSTGVFAYAESAEGAASPSDPSIGGEEVSNTVVPGIDLSNADEALKPGDAADDTKTEAQTTPETAGVQPDATPDGTAGEPEATGAQSDAAPDGTLRETEATGAQPEAVPENAANEAEAENSGETISPYAIVPVGTCLYRDQARKDVLGELTADTVMLVRVSAEYGNGSVLYEVYFDTDRTVQNEACERAYFISSSLKRLSRKQTEVYLDSDSAHRVDGKPVLMAAVRDAAPAEDGEVEDGSNQSRVNRPDVNMRSEPNQESARLARLQKGEKVEVTSWVMNADGETWYAVSAQGREGFIRADFVDAAGDVPEMRSGDDSIASNGEISGEPEAGAPEETPGEPEAGAPEGTPDEPEAGAPTEIPDEPEADAPEGTPDEPEAGAPEGTPGDAGQGMTCLYPVKCFDAEGSLIAIYEVEGGKALAEEIGLLLEGDCDWYPCDANGDYTGTDAFDFSRAVEGPVYIRAGVGGQDAAPEDGVPALPQRKIAIATTRDTETLQLGSQITLTATLTGYEGLNYTCCWQYATVDREGNLIGEWQDAQADALSISYTLAEDNLLAAWRLCVTITEGALTDAAATMEGEQQ